MFVVDWVGEDRFEVRVSPAAAAVLWWAGALGGREDRVVGLGVGVEKVFDDDLVLPVIAEVVGVAEAVAVACDQFAESDLALVADPSSGSGMPNSCPAKENACMW